MPPPPQPEQLYIQALSQRYATTSSDTQQRGIYYMLAMKSVYEKLGTQDPDAGALYAYSLMNLRPWLWWTISSCIRSSNEPGNTSFAA